jgi:hypothetical protein
MKAQAEMRTVVALAIGFIATPLLAAEREESELPAHHASLSDEEVDARLDYLIRRLDDRRGYATLWWRGWTGFYALGVVVQSTRAGFEDRDHSARADYIVSAVKALGGTINLLRHPLAWTGGADVVREHPNETREDREARLALAEETLRERAEAADRRYGWLSHVMNVGINAAGAAIVHAGWDAPTRAWRSAGIGIAVGELMLLSHPWWYRNDFDEYERRFDRTAPEPKVSWHIVPTLNGVMVHARF